MKHQSLIAVILTIFACSGFAAPAASTTPSKAHPFIGIHLGDGKTMLGKPKTLGTTIPTSDRNENGLAVNLSVGNLFPINVHTNWGVEFGFGRYANSSLTLNPGNNSIIKLDYKNYHIDLLASLYYTIKPNWSLFSKLGMSYINQSLDIPHRGVKGPSGSIDSNNKILPKVVIGGGINLTQNTLVALSYETTFLGAKSESADLTSQDNTNYNRVVNYQAIMLGFNYSF